VPPPRVQDGSSPKFHATRDTLTQHHYYYYYYYYYYPQQSSLQPLVV